jgi:4-amino-4-deoxy-L-arabinose transferase-like glycosyltransferase
VAAPSHRSAARTSLTAAEALVLTVAVVFIAVAETSLLLADLRRWSLPANIALAAATLVGLALVVVRRRPAITWNSAQAVAVVVTSAVAALFALPGFPVGLTGLDPGVYTNHAISIARTGDYDVPDPVAEHRAELPPLQEDAAARLPGMSFRDHDADRSLVGYFHLFPALAAPAAELGGERGVVNVNPVLGIVTALLLLLVAWRAFGPLAGWAAGLLSATNVIQVWHARYPTSEMLTELLLVLALLAVVIALDTRWRVAAGLAGVCTGLTFVARADGFLLVGLAAVALVALAGTGRFDRRAAWFTIGLAVTLVHAFVQAYHLVPGYTTEQGVPGEGLLGGALAVLLLLGIVLHRALDSGRLRAVDAFVARAREPRWQRRAGIAVVALAVLVVAFNLARPLWSGDRPLDPNLAGSDGYYNARGMLRLSWFLTPLGVLLSLAGLAVVAARRWSFRRWIVVVPALVLVPIYLWNAHVDVRLMWWTRRFVPVALPGLLLLAGCALGALGGARRAGLRVVGALAAVALVGWWVSMSWPLRDHDELRGSFLVHQAVVDVAGNAPAAWLWSKAGTPPGVDGSGNAFAGSMLLRRGDPVALVDEGRAGAGADAFAELFPDRRLFVVADGDEPPPELEGRVRAVTSIAVDLPIWETTYDRRPTKAGVLPYRFTVWRVR